MEGGVQVGLGGFLEVLEDETLRRSTGALEIPGVGSLYLVFGHPLHATCGELSGVAAVDSIGARLSSEPGLAVSWRPGRTDGKAHSLSPADGVLQRLRGHRDAHDSADGEGDSVGSRSIDSAHDQLDGAAAEVNPPLEQARVAAAVEEVCARIEARLHRHARVLTQVIRAAPAHAAEVLTAIERARSLPVRAVSRSEIATLLDDAERRIREAGSYLEVPSNKD
jgi:hypothetical protein